MQAKPIVKRSIFLFLALLLVQTSSWAQNTETPFRLRTIVIDAGHGGHDPGNLGTGRFKTKEKDIALDVALRVGGYIKTQFPEISVVYTRDTDVFIGLSERADIANKAKADLFISIHCNAATNTSAVGVETYALGLHKNQENLEVAMKENSAIFLEDDYKTKYEGFDPNSAESIIALTIMQSAYLQQSLSISSYIQRQFKDRVGRRDRGVKQAGFLVLRRTTMPSILIELGFLTNASEEDFLNSENGKAFMASAIFRGFKEYKEIVEDPLPEGYVEPEKPASQKDEQAKKQSELDAMMAQLEKAKADSIQKALDQAKIKAVADSLEQVKQKLLQEKLEREAALKKKAEKEQQARLKATADSLEAVRMQKLEEMKKRQDVIIANQAKEEEDQKVKDTAERIARQEEIRKSREAKENAIEWLEEIKAEKQKELESAKTQAAIDEEKKRLEAIKAEKLKQLENARKQAEKDSLHALVENRMKLEQEQATKDSIAAANAKAKLQQESVARSAALAKAREDSVKQVKQRQLELEASNAKAREDSIKQAKQRQMELESARAKAREDSIRIAKKQEADLQAARLKYQQDSIAAARKAEADAIQAQIGMQKAASAEEAELLFLQLRKKQLEERIAKLKGMNVSAPTKTDIEERAAAKPVPENRVDSKTGTGIVYKVQVITSTEPLSSTDSRLRGQQAWEYQQGGLYKYAIGNTQDFEEITKLQAELRNLGFSGAFVVAFNNGERIKVSEARELLSK
ncbi:MAG: N-acetylmuramoyl-L-alanine amidase [Flavobacteriales bacterium]|nr:N-acetylmuramoyl-L-alanine amidase [Flavobacteriales bacterium]